MKKALLALAVAAAMPAVASAQTSIQLTGSVDAGLEWSNKAANANIGKNIRLIDGGMTQSRVAIVGSEDIGGGLKGIFNLEHRFTVDTGVANTKFWHGQAWVGLEGGFGGLRLGRQYTTLFRTMAPGDLTGYTFYYNAFGLGATDGRYDNTIEYRTPLLGGFTGYAQYAPGENPGTISGTAATFGQAWGAGLTGALGPVALGAGYQNRRNVAGVAPSKQIGVSLAGKVGPFGLAGAWGQNKNPVAGVAKVNGYFGSMSMAMGPGTLYVTYRMTKAGTGTYVPLDSIQAKTGLAASDVTKEQGVGVAYLHGLSKRTFLYVAGGLGKQSTLAATGATGSRKPINAVVGMRHFF